jgi:peptide/nickel transport system substrate-binding protein
VVEGDRDPSVPPSGGAGPGDVQIRAFLIADVRGYTLFTQERGDEAAAKLAARFADTAREVIEARGGTLLELRGDEALCVFASPREAIRAAVDLQQRFVQETLERPELPLTVGIGLDAGEAVAVEGGYRGGALNLAARLCGQARAGEILASREITHLARRVDGVRFQDRGELTFKGIADPVAVVRVLPEGEDPAERLRPFGPAPASNARSKGLVIVAAAAALALVAVSLVLLSRDDVVGFDLDANSVARIDAADAALDLTSPLGQRPGAAAIGFGSLWVIQPDRARIARVDLDDGSIEDTIEVGTAPSGVAIGEGSVWVTNAGDGTVTRINADLNTPSDTLRAGSVPSGIAVGGGALWVADSIGAALLRIDPVSHDRTSISLPGQPSSVAFTPGGVWVSIAPDKIARIDPARATVTFQQDVGSGPTAVHAAFRSVWVANQLDATITRLDPSTGHELATIAVGQGPAAVVSAAGRLWVANEYGHSITVIDPSSNVVERTVPVGGTAASLATDGARLWLAVGASGTEHRGGTLVMVSDRRTAPWLDPAVAYDEDVWRILTITNDGLLAYEKVGGPEGSSLVPDLASALPEVSADGLTYRFPLRQGIEYSTGEPVRPEDFRRAIERALALHGAGELLSAIRGARECVDSSGSCDLREGIVVDEESVTFRLASPDPELPFKLAMPFAFPVPADTPAENQRWDPLPATGPYVVEEARRDRIELVRNPAFEEWSAAAQPDGFVDRISWRFGQGVDGFEQLSAGTVDLMLYPPSPQSLATLRATHPDRIVTWPGAFTLFVGFDVRQAPFDDVRVRQALNFAIDRGHVVDLLGGPTVNRVTCQILPPNFQGYAPFCPYTVDPESGVWSAPDVDRAHALIDEAGAAGRPVSVSVFEVVPGAVEVMRYVVDVVRDLGLRPHLRVVHDPDEYFAALNPPTARPGTPAHPDLYVSGWLADYPGAANWIEPQFGCRDAFANTAGWCDRSLEARIDETLALYRTDPGAANREWAEIEHALVAAAAQAPVSNPVLIHVVSDRVENVQVNPQWGLLLSRLWIE